MRRVFGILGVAAMAIGVGVLPAAAREGGLDVDQDRISFENLSPGRNQAGLVSMTNTSTTPLYISAITMRTQSLNDVSLTYTACSQPWADEVCASESLTVADYDLTSLPTEVKTLDYVIEAGHTTYFKLDAAMAGSTTSGTTRVSTQLTFKWTAQTDPPPGATSLAMPSTLTVAHAPEPAPKDVETLVPEAVANVLASTGVPPDMADAVVGASVLSVGGVVIVLAVKARGRQRSVREGK